MKVFVSFDMEGVAGIVDWDQCRPGAAGYDLGRRLLLGEVNAAIDGALDAGATGIVCNDSHGAMANLDPEALHGEATSITGRHKPGYMMEGLDQSFGAVFFVGYHGSISGVPSTLSHTYNPAVVSGVTLEGRLVGESGINALAAAAAGVPVALVSGDAATLAEAEELFPGAELVQVKDSITRFAASSLHPHLARRRIREAARRAVTAAPSLGPPTVPTPVHLEVHLQTADMAEVATWVKGVERSGLRSVTIEGEDLAAAYRSFVAAIYITRVAEGR